MITRLPDDWKEMTVEKKTEFWDFLQGEQVETEHSYKPGEKRVYCHFCGRLIKNGSVSFFEGYHIESCF